MANTLLEFCSNKATSWMCASSPIKVNPAVNTASNNSTVLSSDLQHAILTHVNINVTTSFMLLVGLAILFFIVFMLNKVHKNHILDLHGKFHGIRKERAKMLTRATIEDSN